MIGDWIRYDWIHLCKVWLEYRWVGYVWNISERYCWKIEWGMSGLFEKVWILIQRGMFGTFVKGIVGELNEVWLEYRWMSMFGTFLKGIIGKFNEVCLDYLNKVWILIQRGMIGTFLKGIHGELKEVYMEIVE